jgi:hypothetical protein
MKLLLCVFEFLPGLKIISCKSKLFNYRYASECQNNTVIVWFVGWAPIVLDTLAYPCIIRKLIIRVGKK